LSRLKFAYAELHEKANRWTATHFPKALIKAVPYKIHTVLTDNGIQFTDLPKNRLWLTARWRVHMFDMLCDANGIEHRLTKPNHPWTNGQVERMNRTLKEATVQRYHYGSHAQLKAHVHAFLMAYNFAKRLKTLRGLTPYEHVCKVWTTQPAGSSKRSFSVGRSSPTNECYAIAKNCQPQSVRRPILRREAD
jgi:Integrase core domain